MELNRYIVEKALEKDICKPWARMIANAANKDELMVMYRNGIDFCITNDFPSNNDLVELGSDVINKHGVYVNGEARLNNSNFVVLLGSSFGTLNYSGFEVGQIYVKDKSKITVLAKDNAYVMIDAFGNSSLTVEAYESSKVIINVYGSAKVDVSESSIPSVTIHQKNKETY